MRWFTRRKSLRRLRGISEAEIAQLAVAQIRDQPGLQKAFDDSEDAPIRSISVATSPPPGAVTEARVVELLRASLGQSAKPLIAGHFAVHWADYLVALAVALMIVGLTPYLRNGTIHKWDTVVVVVPKAIWGEVRPESKKPTLIAARIIPALKTLTKDDMKIANGTSEQESRRMAALVGHYAFGPIAVGATIRDEDLSNKNFDFAAVRIIRIATKNVPPVDSHSLPRDVDALFSARDASHAGAQIPAILVSLDPTPSAPTATLALDPKNVAKVANWIGSSDAYILLRP